MRIVYRKEERTVESYIKGIPYVYVMSDRIIDEEELDHFENNIVYKSEQETPICTLSPQAVKDATKHQSAKRREEYKTSMNSNKSAERLDTTSTTKKFISEIKKSSDKSKKKKKT